jgi:hypothetical protein
MAGIIIFGSLSGVAPKEGKGSRGCTKTLLFLGLLMLVCPMIAGGVGDYLAQAS